MKYLKYKGKKNNRRITNYIDIFNSNLNRKKADYIKTVFLYYSDGKNYKDVYDYPRFMREELNITNGEKYCRYVMREGLIKEEENGIFLTDKGIQYIEKNYDYIRLFEISSSIIKPSEYFKALEVKKNKDSFLDVAIDIIEEKLNSALKNEDFRLAMTLCRELANLYKEKNEINEALRFITLYLYIKTSGVVMYDALLLYMSKKITEVVLKKQNFIITIPNDVIEFLKKHANEYDLNVARLVFTSNKLNMNLLNQKEFVNLIEDIVKNTWNMSKWRTKFSNSYKKIFDLAHRYQDTLL